MKKKILFLLIAFLIIGSLNAVAFYEDTVFKNHNRDLKYREGVDSKETMEIPNYYGEDKEIINLPYEHFRLDKPHNLKDHYRKPKRKTIFNLKRREI